MSQLVTMFLNPCGGSDVFASSNEVQDPVFSILRREKSHRVDLRHCPRAMRAPGWWRNGIALGRCSLVAVACCLLVCIDVVIDRCFILNA